jgi:hypothetical protein
VAAPVEEASDEPRLARAGGGEKRHQPRPLGFPDVVQHRRERDQRLCSPDEREVVSADAALRGAGAKELVGGDALGLALELQRLDGLDLDGVPDEIVRWLPDQHLARRSVLFEPRRDVHRVAGDESLAGGDVAGDDLARVDAGPVLETHAVVTLETLVDDFEGVPHLGRRAHGAERVVLV